MTELSRELPIPNLEARPITGEQYHAHTPEKFELCGGYLFHAADDPDARRRLLGLFLVNVGLLEVVRLVSEEAGGCRRWGRLPFRTACETHLDRSRMSLPA